MASPALHNYWLLPGSLGERSKVEGRLQIEADSMLNIQSENWTGGVKASLILKNVPPSFKPAFLNLLHTWQQSVSKKRAISFSGNPGTLSQLHRSCSFLHMLSLSWSLCQMTVVVVRVVLISLEFTPYKRLKNSLWNSLNREKKSPLDYSSLNEAEVI